MNLNRIAWVGRHEGILRDVARACAYGDPMAQKQAGRILSAYIPNKCVLVPMPSHIGYATTMLSLCRWIETVINMDTGLRGVSIWDGLVCDPHESSHIVKLRNGVPPQIKMYAKKKPPEGSVFIIDNTIATGATASAALEVIPNATVLALTKG